MKKWIAPAIVVRGRLQMLLLAYAAAGTAWFVYSLTWWGCP